MQSTAPGQKTARKPLLPRRFQSEGSVAITADGHADHGGEIGDTKCSNSKQNGHSELLSCRAACKLVWGKSGALVLTTQSILRSAKNASAVLCTSHKDGTKSTDDPCKNAMQDCNPALHFAKCPLQAEAERPAKFPDAPGKCRRFAGRIAKQRGAGWQNAALHRLHFCSGRRILMQSEHRQGCAAGENAQKMAAAAAMPEKSL